MAKGSSFLGGVVNKVKKTTKRITSNLAVDPGATKRRAKAARKSDTDAIGNYIAEKDLEINGYMDTPEGKQILDDMMGLTKRYDRVIGDEYYGNKQKDLTKAKTAEYKKRKAQASKDNTAFDKRATMKELDDSGVYNIDDPYKGVDAKYDTDLLELESKKAKALAKGQKDYNKNPNKYEDAEIDKVIADSNAKYDKDYDAIKGTDAGKANRASLKTETDSANALRGTNKAYDSSSISKDYDDQIKSLEEKLGTDKESIFKESGLRQGSREDALSEILGGGRSASSNASDYFFDGPKAGENTGEVMASRIGATALGGTGLMLGTRYLTGGNMSYNADGEKDIAGIPFI